MVTELACIITLVLHETGCRDNKVVLNTMPTKSIETYGDSSTIMDGKSRSQPSTISEKEPHHPASSEFYVYEVLHNSL